jgi:CheY-like chemotaxis protein
MKRPSVLVVDDNRDAADMIAVMLDISGWDTRAVYSGPDALAAVAQSRPDVILLDIGMPEMSGFTVASRLKRTYGARCPVLVALTAWADAATKAQCKAVGMVKHLAKPVEMTDLVSSLDAVIRPAQAT